MALNSASREAPWLGGNWDTSIESIVLIALDGRSIVAESHEEIKKVSWQPLS